MATLYISTTTLKRDTPLGSAVDDNILHPQIVLAQDRYILPVLGTQLDDELKNLIQSNGISNPAKADYKTMLDEYLVPCLVQFAFIEVAYALRLRFSNNTITMPDSEQGSNADISDLKMLLDRVESMAMFYRQRLIDHLCYNNEKFPEYSKATEDDLRATQRNYFQNLNVYDRRTIDNQTQAFLSAINYKP